MNENIIELKNLTVSFEGETILNHINLAIRNKEFVTLLGPSGCGKTTTLRIIGGFLTPDCGEVLFDGKDISSLAPHKRPLNTVFQKYALFPHLNVFDNIAFGLKIQKLPQSEIRRRVNHMLKSVNLEGFGNRRTSQLSGGQQQRVAIARALVNYPKVLLLDEPLGALDLKLRKEMQLELKQMQQKLQTTFIYVTHDQEEALTMSDTIVVMNEGEIQQIGSPQDIYNEPKNAFVADFIGESNIINGMMRKDYEVEFAGRVHTCVDKGFGSMKPVDVVVRPEDIALVDPEQAEITGQIESVVFKGVHYEIEVKADGNYWLIHTTRFAEPGQRVGLRFQPNDIHIMKKMFAQTTNQFPGTVIGPGAIFIDWLNLSFSRPDLRLEEGCSVMVTVPPDAVQIVSADHSDAVMYLESMIYKGDHNEMHFYIEDQTQQDHYLLVYSQDEEQEVGTELGLKFHFERLQVSHKEREQ